MTIKNRIAAALLSIALISGGGVAAASAAQAAAPSCLVMTSGATSWYITNKCGRTVTYTVIRPWWFDQKVTIAAGATNSHPYTYHGIK